jgi:small subunit ribosomal protein S4
MGDPRKLRNKYESPRKVWDADRIKRDKGLTATYGLKNTREIWVALRELKKARSGAMKYLSLGETGAEKGRPLMERLIRLGIVPPDGKLDDVLALSVENFLDRRLQTRVMKKGLARTAGQARQLVTHGFIAVGGKCVTIPSYVVSVKEEPLVSYYKPIDIAVHEEDKSAKSASKKEEAPEAAAPSEAPSEPEKTA